MFNPIDMARNMKEAVVLDDDDGDDGSPHNAKQKPMGAGLPRPIGNKEAKRRAHGKPASHTEVSLKTEERADRQALAIDAIAKSSRALAQQLRNQNLLSSCIENAKLARELGDMEDVRLWANKAKALANELAAERLADDVISAVVDREEVPNEVVLDEHDPNVDVGVEHHDHFHDDPVASAQEDPLAAAAIMDQFHNSHPVADLNADLNADVNSITARAEELWRRSWMHMNWSPMMK